MSDDRSSQTLSATELAVLQLLATGATNREIAHERSVSEATVKKHVTNINGKLGTGNRTEAVRRALEQGLVTVEVSEPSGPVDGDAARWLATELEKARRVSRRTNRAFAAVALAGFAAVALAFALDLNDIVGIVVGPEPTATAPPTPMPSPPGAVWLPGRDLPSPRAGMALVADGSSVYAIGGEDASGVLSDTIRYDIDSISWLRSADKPTAVRDAAAVALDGRFVVPGGCTADGSATDVVEVYDPRSDSWESADPLPDAVCGYALVGSGGRAYLLGGRSGTDPATATDTVWRYEPEAGAWEPHGRLPLPRSDLAAVFVGDQVHVLGGMDPGGRPQSSHWVYSPLDAGNRWNTEGGPPLPQARAGLVAAGLLRSVYLIGGGWDSPVDDATLVWDVDDADGAWLPFSEPRGPTPQRGAGLAVFQGQWLYIAGGVVESRMLDQTQSIRVVWRIQPPQPPR